MSDEPSFGGVYAFQEEGGARMVKIGEAQNIRARGRGIQIGNPHQLRLKWFRRVDDVQKRRAMEVALHSRFEALRVRGEWFRPEVLDTLRRRVDSVLRVCSIPADPHYFLETAWWVPIEALERDVRGIADVHDRQREDGYWLAYGNTNPQRASARALGRAASLDEQFAIVLKTLTIEWDDSMSQRPGLRELRVELDEKTKGVELEQHHRARLFLPAYGDHSFRDLLFSDGSVDIHGFLDAAREVFGELCERWAVITVRPGEKSVIPSSG